MAYRIAGIDVHKKMLAVVVADVEVEGEYQFERCRFGATPEHLRLLAEWLLEREADEVVMESTAQYWQPVWGALERYWRPTCQKREGAGPMSGKLHLAQALSNRGRRGRKKDFPDAERLVNRLVAQELVLSFVPDPEQRLWRTVTRRKLQLTRLRWFPICWASVRGVCCERWPRGKPIPRFWPPWRMSACEPRQPSCAMRWAPVPSSTLSTGGC